MGKARTVTSFNGAIPGNCLYNSSQPSGPNWGIQETNGGLVVFGSGLPIFMGNNFIGAVGCSKSLITDVDIQVATGWCGSCWDDVGRGGKRVNTDRRI